MYKITGVTDEDKALIIEALQSPTREFKQRVSFGYWTVKNGVRTFNKSFEITSVNSASIKQTACSDSSTLTFGCCCSNSAELDFFNPNYGAETSAESKYSGKIIFIEQAIKYKDGTDEDGSEYFYWFPFGYFKAETATSDDKWFTVKLTAYDDVYLMTDKFNTNLFANGAESVSAYALINELASRYNLTLEFGAIEEQLLRQAFFTVEQAETLTSYSDAQALGYLAGIAGANARINTLGHLDISWYSTPESYSMPTTVQWQNGLVKKSEDAFEINSITAGADDDVYTCGTGLGLSSVNPVISQTNVANIWTHLFQAEPAISFLPCEIDWRGDPRIEAGDCISVYDETGTAYDVFIAEQSIDLTGGLSAKITCPTGDGDMSFDTLEEATRRALNKQKTNLQKAIETATNSINGAKGGFFEIIDSDSDGNPDGWLIKEDEGGSSGIIRANKEGIGLSKDGGKTYKTAVTYDGINASALICDSLSSTSVKIGDSSKQGAYEVVIESGQIDFKGAISDGSLGRTAKMRTGYTKNGNTYTGKHFAIGYISNISGTGNDGANSLKLGSFDSETDQFKTLLQLNGSEGAVFSADISGKINVLNKLGHYESNTEHNLNAEYVSANEFSVGYKHYSTSKNGNEYAWRQHYFGAYVDTSYRHWTGWQAYSSSGSFMHSLTAMQADYSSDTTVMRFAASSSSAYIAVGSNAAYFQKSYGIYNKDREMLGIYCDDVYLSNGTASPTPVKERLSDLYANKVNISITGTEQLSGETHYDSLLRHNNNLTELYSVTGKTKVNGETHSAQLDGLKYINTYSPDGKNFFVRFRDYAVQANGEMGCSENHNFGFYTDAGHNVYANIYAANINSSSSQEYKKNISAADMDALNLVKESKIYSFNYKTDSDSDFSEDSAGSADSNTNDTAKSYGFIVERETPEEVISDDGKAVNLYAMASVNWKATQELLQKITALEEKITAMEGTA